MRTADGKIHDERDRAFFDYTLIDHAVYDLATQIDYILETTGSKSVSFFGHSQVST